MRHHCLARGWSLVMLAVVSGCATAPVAPPTMRAAEPAALAMPSRDARLAEQASLLKQAEHLRASAQYDAAESLYARALAIAQEVDGPDSLAVAAVLRDYAQSLRLAGEEEDAASMDARVRQITESAQAAPMPVEPPSVPR